MKLKEEIKRLRKALEEIELTEFMDEDLNQRAITLITLIQDLEQEQIEERKRGTVKYPSTKGCRD